MKVIYESQTGKEPISKKSGCCTPTPGQKRKFISPEIEAKIANHPCYSEQAHHHFARMHVAVAPACNMQCNYCNRKYDCANESRPGVVSERLSPSEAARKVKAVAAEIPQMTVVGVAGPGDPLANPKKTFETFELLTKSVPDIKLCLSTNGLALPDYVDVIKNYNIEHVTITINAIEPEVGAQIYPWIFYNHRRWKGLDASKILIEKQLEGLEMLTAAGILCKINSVMIPGINDEHLVSVNEAVNSRGAFLHNIMPLIAKPEHGTHFGLNGQREPTASELKELQDRLAVDMKMMRHCRQCRADAVGLLGQDRNQEFTLDKLPTEQELEKRYDPDWRKRYQEHLLRQVSSNSQMLKRELNLIDNTLTKSASAMTVAVATRGDNRINEHFGHVREFLIYEVSSHGPQLIGQRSSSEYCAGGYGEEESLSEIIETLSDCEAVFVSKIGGCPAQELSEAGMKVVTEYAHEQIDRALLDYYLNSSNKNQIERSKSYGL